MKYMMTYDLMEATRNTNQWLGATARAFADYPIMSWTTNPAMDWLRAWGDVTERTFSRMVVKPDWNIPPVPTGDGRDHPVDVNIVLERDFGDLIHINVQGREPPYDGAVGRNDDPARGLQIRRRGAHGLSGSFAACLVHLHER